MFESLVETNTDVKLVRRDGASALALCIFSNNTRIMNHIPKMIEYDESAGISYVRRLPLALRRGLCFDDISSGVSIQDRRSFIICNIDLLQDPT